MCTDWWLFKTILTAQFMQYQSEPWSRTGDWIGWDVRLQCGHFILSHNKHVSVNKNTHYKTSLMNKYVTIIQMHILSSQVFFCSIFHINVHHLHLFLLNKSIVIKITLKWSSESIQSEYFDTHKEPRDIFTLYNNAFFTYYLINEIQSCHTMPAVVTKHLPFLHM